MGSARFIKGQLFSEAVEKGKQKPFQDPYFPQLPDVEYFKSLLWKRPQEICADPKILCEQSSSQQNMCVSSNLKATTLLAACIKIIGSRAAFVKQLIPDLYRQEYQNQGTASTGVVRCQLYHLGQWVEILIDDRLPFKDGSPQYSQTPHHPSQFWAAFIEKAFVKLRGGYLSAAQCSYNEILIDLTGGFAQLDALKFPTILESKKNAWEIIKMGLKHNNIVALVPSKKPTEPDNQQTTTNSENGESAQHNDEKCIQAGIPYQVLEGIEIMDDTIEWALSLVGLQSGEGSRLFRIGAPGLESNWSGAWSRGSSQWSNLSPTAINSMPAHWQADGTGPVALLPDQFVVDVETLVRLFSHVLVVRPGKQSVLEAAVHGGGLKEVWGNWEPRDQVVNEEQLERQMFQHERVLMVSIAHKSPATIKVKLTFCLQQQNKKWEQAEYDAISVQVYHCEINRDCRPTCCDHVVTQIPTILHKSREVTSELTLENGSYLVIPTTYNARSSSNWHLRVQYPATSTCTIKDIPMYKPPATFLQSAVRGWLRVKLKTIWGLPLAPLGRTVVVHAVLHFGGQYARGPSLKLERDTSVGQWFVFSVKNPKNPGLISIKVIKELVIGSKVLGHVDEDIGPYMDGLGNGKSSVVKKLDESETGRGRIHFDLWYYGQEQ